MKTLPSTKQQAGTIYHPEGGNVTARKPEQLKENGIGHQNENWL
jgi:hypothetical protein